MKREFPLIKILFLFRMNDQRLKRAMRLPAKERLSGAYGYMLPAGKRGRIILLFGCLIKKLAVREAIIRIIPKRRLQLLRMAAQGRSPQWKRRKTKITLHGMLMILIYGLYQEKLHIQAALDRVGMVSLKNGVAIGVRRKIQLLQLGILTRNMISRIRERIY